MTDEVVLPTNNIIEVVTENVGRASANVFYTVGGGGDTLLTRLQASGIAQADWPTDSRVYDVITEFAADCCAESRVGDISNCGPLYCTGPTIRLYNSAGLDHSPAPLDGRLGATIMLRGTCFLRYDSAYNMVPVFSGQTGTTLKCFGMAADRYNEGLGLDPTNYPTITGTLKPYAPFFCTDHTRDNTGANVAHAQDCDFINLELTVLGMPTAFLGDADPAVETWATDVASGKGGACGGARAVLKGCGMDWDFRFNRNTISTDVLSGVLVDFGPQHWPALQSQRSSAQLVRDPTMSESADTPLHAYRQINCESMRGGHRWVGVALKGKTRGATVGLLLEAGAAPSSWSAAVTDPDYPVDDPDNGKYTGSSIDLYGEGVPTMLRCAGNAFLHRMERVAIGGICKDTYAAHRNIDPPSTEPVIDILTDKDEAGYLRKGGTEWISVTQFSVGNTIDLNVLICEGAVVRWAANADKRRWKFTGLIANWGHGGNTSGGGVTGMWAFDNPCSDVYIHAGLSVYAGSHGSVRVFNTPSLDNLYCTDQMEWFGYNTSVVPIDTTVCSILAGFSPGGVCYATWSDSDDGTTDDGGGDDG